MHPHDQHVLVVRAVEDADEALARRSAIDAPKEIVGKLFDAGLLERRHLAALRIEALHHVADRAVLAGRVHALQHQQQRAAAFGVKPVAEVVELGDVLIELGLHPLPFVSPPV